MSLGRSGDGGSLHHRLEGGHQTDPGRGGALPPRRPLCADPDRQGNQNRVRRRYVRGRGYFIKLSETSFDELNEWGCDVIEIF